MGAGEIVSAHTVLCLGAADDRFDRRPAAEFAFDGLGDATSLARDIDLELMVGRGVVAAIAVVGDDAGEVGADQRLDLRDHGGQGVAVIRVAGQRLGVGDELAALGAIARAACATGANLPCVLQAPLARQFGVRTDQIGPVSCRGVTAKLRATSPSKSPAAALCPKDSRKRLSSLGATARRHDG